MGLLAGAAGLGWLDEQSRAVVVFYGIALAAKILAESIENVFWETVFSYYQKNGKPFC